jgi:hypothetical protein
MLSMAVAGDPRAAWFVDPDAPAQARGKALDILNRKIGTLERFAQAYPGFGGFLPWFVHCNSGRDIKPAWNYQDHVLSKQNAGFVWALFLTDYLLEQAGETALARRYEAYWRQLAARAVPMFFDPECGRIRTASRIIEQPDGSYRYALHVDSSHAEEPQIQPSYNEEWLDQPFFGELMTLFMTLFSAWEDPSAPAEIWADKTVEPAVYHTRNGQSITVCRGIWYSAIEMSHLLYLPYVDVPLVRELVRSGEAARTVHSNEHGIPGLYSMVNIPHGLHIKGAEELYAVGIPSLASQQVVFTNVIAAYAAFPVILADRPTGLAWLLNVLKANRMQGPYGMSEGVTVDGQHTALFLTWYAKGSVLLALLQPELNQLMRKALQQHRVYDRFIDLIQTEYRDAFGAITNLAGRDIEVEPPLHNVPIPPGLKGFQPQQEQVNLLQGLPFRGGDALAECFYRDADDNLCMEATNGFIYTWITPVNAATHPYMVFRYSTRDKGVFGFEIKNRFGMPLNRERQADRYRGRIMVHVDNTQGQWKTCCIDLRPLLKQADQTVITFVLVDPTTGIRFSSDGTEMAAKPPVHAVLLTETAEGFVSPADRQ